VRSNDLLVKDVAAPNGLDSSSVLRSQSINQREHPMDEHFVQFYESEAFLIDSIASFVSSGFDSGEIVLVLATAPHLNALRARLLEKQIPIELLGFSCNLMPRRFRQI
jgi:DcmR-like sensory protein